MSNEETGKLKQVRDAKERLKAAKRSHDIAVKSATKELEAAKRLYEREVSARRKAVDDARSSLTGKVDGIPGVTLFGDRLAIDGKEMKLDDDLEIDLSSSGLTSGKGKAEGCLYLSVVSAEDSVVKQLPLSAETQIRGIIAKSRQLTKTLDARRESAEKAAAVADARLTEAINDTHAVNELSLELSRITDDKSEIEAAQKELDDLVASTDPGELKQEAAQERKKKFLQYFPIASLVLGVLFVLVGLGAWAPPMDIAGGCICLLLADALIVAAAVARRIRVSG